MTLGSAYHASYGTWIEEWCLLNLHIIFCNDMTNSGDILYQEKEIDVLLHLCLYTPKFKHIQQLIVMEKQFV